MSSAESSRSRAERAAARFNREPASCAEKRLPDKFAYVTSVSGRGDPTTRQNGLDKRMAAMAIVSVWKLLCQLQGCRNSTRSGSRTGAGYPGVSSGFVGGRPNVRRDAFVCEHRRRIVDSRNELFGQDADLIRDVSGRRAFATTDMMRERIEGTCRQGRQRK